MSKIIRKEDIESVISKLNQEKFDEKLKEKYKVKSFLQPKEEILQSYEGMKMGEVKRKMKECANKVKNDYKLLFNTKGNIERLETTFQSMTPEISEIKAKTDDNATQIEIYKSDILVEKELLEDILKGIKGNELVTKIEEIKENKIVSERTISLLDMMLETAGMKLTPSLEEMGMDEVDEILSEAEKALESD